MTSFARHLDERQAMLDGLRASDVAASVAAASDHRIVYHYICGRIDTSLASPTAAST